LANNHARRSRIFFGVRPGRAPHGGSLSRIRAMVSDTVSPRNAARPVNASKRQHPNARMSVLLSRTFPRACSGLMYAAVPRMTPVSVGLRVTVGDSDRCPFSFDVNAFARLKSRTFAFPSSVSLTFEGFRSRWRMPLS
jgi:hypothetical protein